MQNKIKRKDKTRLRLLSCDKTRVRTLPQRSAAQEIHFQLCTMGTFKYYVTLFSSELPLIAFHGTLEKN